MLDWALQAFERHRTLIVAAIPGADVYHVGSTGIGFGLTKGDLDICVRVDAAGFRAAERSLLTIYARNTGSDSSETFAAFEDRCEWVGVQLCARNGPEDSFVRLRNILRARPLLVQEYDALKRRHHSGDMTRYRQEKSTFIERVLASSVAQADELEGSDHDV